MIAYRNYAAMGVVFATGIIVAFAQLLPPLTQPAKTELRYENDRALIHQVDEYAFCRDSLSGIDCGCFSYRASAVLRRDPPRVRGMMYADKWELALSQASASCQK